MRTGAIHRTLRIIRKKLCKSVSLEVEAELVDERLLPCSEVVVGPLRLGHPQHCGHDVIALRAVRDDGAGSAPVQCRVVPQPRSRATQRT